MNTFALPHNFRTIILCSAAWLGIGVLVIPALAAVDVSYSTETVDIVE